MKGQRRCFVLVVAKQVKPDKDVWFSRKVVFQGIHNLNESVFPSMRNKYSSLTNIGRVLFL